MDIPLCKLPIFALKSVLLFTFLQIVTVSYVLLRIMHVSSAMKQVKALFVRAANNQTTFMGKFALKIVLIKAI